MQSRSIDTSYIETSAKPSITPKIVMLKDTPQMKQSGSILNTKSRPISTKKKVNGKTKHVTVVTENVEEKKDVLSERERQGIIMRQNFSGLASSQRLKHLERKHREHF